MVTAVNDYIFSHDFMSDPYTYFAQLRENDPVHWNEKYQLWLVTRHEDLLWLTRHPELFSSVVLRTIPGRHIPPSMSRIWAFMSLSKTFSPSG